MTNLVVIPGGVPGLSWAASGLLLGCLGSLRALWLLLLAPGCFWASPVASLLEPRKITKMTSIMTNLVAQIKATANFLGLGESLASERYV